MSVLANVWILEHARIELFGLGKPNPDKQANEDGYSQLDALCVGAIWLHLLCSEGKYSSHPQAPSVV